MGEYGIRITQAGIPVSRAADYQEVMDERWPVLEFLFEGIVTIENAKSQAAGTIDYIPIFSHKLGYLPGYFFKNITNDVNTSNNSVSNQIFADDQNIYLRVIKTAGVVVTVNLKFFLAVIDRNCSLEFQSPIDVTTADQVTNPSTYGLKVLNHPSGQGMNERDKSLYSFNTNAKSMSLQQTGIRSAVSPNFTIAVDHRLGYPPTYFLARRTPVIGSADPFLGKVTIKPLGNGGGVGKSSSITLTIRGGQAALTGDYMFVILKDPVGLAR